MDKRERELIHAVITQANHYASEYDIEFELVEDAEDHVEIKMIDTDGPEDSDGTHLKIRYVGVFHDCGILQVEMSGDNPEDTPRFIDARGHSLFAIAYC